MGSKGQVTIEFLLVFSAILIFISFFIGLFPVFENASIFAIDSQNAKTFISDITYSANTLALLSDGSKKQFEYSILNKWEINDFQNKKVLLVKAENKTVSFPFPLTIKVNLENKSFTNKISVFLKKENGLIVLSE